MADPSTVSPTTRDRIVMALWTPVILMLLGIGAGVGLLAVAVGVFALLVAVRGDSAGMFADVASAVGGSVDVGLAVTLIVGAIVVLYVMLARETWGDEPVDKTLNQAEEYVPDGGEGGGEE